MQVTKPHNRCDACGQEDLGPMLRDDVWQKIAAPNEMLCGKCTLDRSVAKLGRVTTFADLLPCPFNLFRQPVSWFDVFTQLEGPPWNLAEWRAAGAPMTTEQWRALRKAAGLKIDPETAEVTWEFGSGLDPYGLHDLSGEKNDYVRRNCFARAPKSAVWILFGDLPEQVREALWEKHRAHLAAFPTALVPIEIHSAKRKRPRALIVEAGSVRPSAAYNLVALQMSLKLNEANEAVIYGWEWGHKLLTAPTKDFGYGALCHCIPCDELRHPDELKALLGGPHGRA